MISFREIFHTEKSNSSDWLRMFDFYHGAQGGIVGILWFYLFLHFSCRFIDYSRFSPALQLLLKQLPFIIGGIGGSYFGMRQSFRQYGWRKVLDLPGQLPLPRKSFFLLLLKWLPILSVGSILLNAASIWLLQGIGIQKFPQQYLENVGLSGSFAFWAAAFFSTVVITPFTEEILFRRILYQGLKSIDLSYAELATAFLFSLCHGLPQAFVSFLLISLILQQGSRVGSLWLAILLHASFNLVMFCLLIAKLFYFSA
ncbi:MAG: CPBP family intramembrane glutamic endopeptidase [Lentisphaeria bacterium]